MAVPARALTIRPIEGDNTVHIQTALDEIGALPRARRGALLLLPGVYPVAGTVYVRASGTVLRGVGDGEDPSGNTIVKATGNNPKDRNVIVAGGVAGGGWKGEVPGTRTGRPGRSASTRSSTTVTSATYPEMS
ncbi:hypothetical protein [Nonomuraea sp. 10N515B]|uniref:hypothetical protein n=1 Tax=Nonomuraea sp. 10N515B TaxID=3457422 RepID=UPI003FCE50E0